MSSSDPGRPADFLVGANLPWLTYGCDFGANAWQPGGGVGTVQRLHAVDEILARLSASGLRAVRWFVLCDGRSGVLFDADGLPRGIDGFLFRDLDAALASATRHHVSLMLVLFDFPWCARRRVVEGVRLGGRRRLIAQPATRSLVFEHVVRPILQRYGREPGIAGWDVFNEPEWATLGYGSLNPATSLWPSSMRKFLHDLVGLVHDDTRHPATIGLASPRGLRLLRGIELDLYQLHWYDRRSRFISRAAGGKGGRPVLLGEFPTKGSARSVEEILEGARRRGYCGAFGWSALASDGHSELSALERAVRPRLG